MTEHLGFETRKLQFTMFQTLYKLRLPEVGADLAFASAIADSSDEKAEEAIKRNPAAFKLWVENYESPRSNEISRRFSHGR